MITRYPSLLTALGAIVVATLPFAATGQVFGQASGSSAGTPTVAPDAARTLAKVGQPAPAFTLTEANGTAHTLADYRGKLVVLQWINPDCPVCRKASKNGTVAAMRKEIDATGTPWVHLTINSTHYMKPGKSAEYLAAHKLEIPALLDADGTVGRLYQAKTTPHLYVIDQAGVLRYSGAINDDARGTKGDSATNYAVNAVRQLVAGETVAPDSTRPYGCSVKYAPANGEKSDPEAQRSRRRGGDRANRANQGDRSERRREMLKRFDADGDGKLNETERMAARQAMKAEMLKKYDADGDGELSESERKVMRKAEGREGRGKGQRRGGTGRSQKKDRS